MKTCCNQEVRKAKEPGDGGTTKYTIWCESCGRIGTGSTVKESEEAFDSWGDTAPTTDTPNKIAPVHQQASKTTERGTYLINSLNNRGSIGLVAPFVQHDRPALKMMIDKNIRYAMGLNGEKWDQIWASEEGAESITFAVEEALLLGATMPDMGCILPFGTVAVFIPDVSAYQFAVTTGHSAPFDWFEITPLYQNDKYEINQSPGVFDFRITKISIPRGDVIGIVPHGKLRDGRIVGKIYEKKELLEKAAEYSPGYKAHIQNVRDLENAKISGEMKKDPDGREYVVKHIEYIKNGQKKSFDKKVYFDESTSLYEGASSVDMLSKMAGKSFLRKFIKTRNSTAAMYELSESTGSSEPADELDAVLDAALKAVPCEG